jgi:hypothetical protein
LNSNNFSSKSIETTAPSLPVQNSSLFVSPKKELIPSTQIHSKVEEKK